MPAPPAPSGVPPPLRTVVLPGVAERENTDRSSIVGKGETRTERLERRRKALRRIYLPLIFIMGVACMALGINLKDKTGSGTGSMYALFIGIVGTFVMFTSLAGFWMMKHLRGLLGYFIFVLLEAILLFIFGGICFFLKTDVALNFVDEGSFMIEEGEEDNSSVSGQLIALGSCSIITALLLMRVIRSVGKMVGTLRALVILLQTTNLTLLPFGLMFMAAGFFVADSSQGSASSTDAVAIIFLGVGATIASVSFLGCLAAATFSRNMLIVYSAFISFVMSVLLAGGVAAFILTDEVQAYMADNWEEIRLAFPPTFSGRYDKNAMEQWLKQNLKTLGYASFVFGIYCCGMLITAFNLRNRFIESGDEGEAGAGKKRRSVARMIQALGGTQTVEYHDDADGGIGRSVSSRPGVRRQQSVSQILKRKWTDRWMKSTPQERRKFRLAGLCLCITLLVPLLLGMTLLMYDVFCESISGYKRDFTSTVKAMENVGTISIAQMYGSGHTYVFLDKDEKLTNGNGVEVYVTGNVTAGKEDHASKTGLEHSQVADTLLFDLLPAPPSTIMGQDVSCQVGTLTTYLSPDAFSPATARKLRATAENHLTVEMPRANNADPNGYFYAMDLQSDHGTIVVRRVTIGPGGSTMRNYNGSIEMYSVDAAGVPSGAHQSAMDFETDIGGVLLESVNTKDTRIRIHSLNGPVKVSGVKASTTKVQTNGEINIVGKRATVDLESIESDIVDVSTSEGQVRAKKTEVRKSFKANTGKGTVTLTELIVADDGLVEIETDSGDVKVEILLLDGFFGQYNINTGSGRVCVSGSTRGLFIPEEGSEIVDSASSDASCVSKSDGNSHSGSIPGTSNKNPVYGGEIIITSNSGNIDLKIVGTES